MSAYVVGVAGRLAVSFPSAIAGTDKHYCTGRGIF